MKNVRNWMAIVGILGTALVLQTVPATAGGDDDPPHGRPELSNGDQAVMSRQIGSAPGERSGGVELTSGFAMVSADDPLDGLWGEIERLLDQAPVGF